MHERAPYRREQIPLRQRVADDLLEPYPPAPAGQPSTVKKRYCFSTSLADHRTIRGFREAGEGDRTEEEEATPEQGRGDCGKRQGGRTRIAAAGEPGKRRPPERGKEERRRDGGDAGPGAEAEETRERWRVWVSSLHVDGNARTVTSFSFLSAQ